MARLGGKSNAQLRPGRGRWRGAKGACQTKGPGVAAQALEYDGEPVGVRTRDLLIKSHAIIVINQWITGFLQFFGSQQYQWLAFACAAQWAVLTDMRSATE